MITSGDAGLKLGNERGVVVSENSPVDALRTLGKAQALRRNNSVAHGRELPLASTAVIHGDKRMAPVRTRR